MKRLLALLAASALAVAGVATTATAAGLQFSVNSTLAFSNLGHVTASATGTGVAVINGAGGLGHLTSLEFASGAVTIDTVIPVTDPIVTQGGIVEVRITSLKASPRLAGGQGGVFAPISGALANTQLQLTKGTMAATGMVRICLVYAGCNSGSLDTTLGQSINGVRIGAGIGGLITIGGAGSIRISIVGAPWTVKTVSVSNRTDNGGITIFQKHGFAHGPASLTSSTAISSGALQLVTASQTTTVGVPGNSDRSGQITITRLHFIPEPGLFLLLGAGAAGLAAIGRRRLRK
jgi:hypothetical protein